MTEQENDRLSLIAGVGYSASSCGYCGEPGKRSATKSSKSFGIWAHHMTPQAYQSLIDRGWRRSGSYIYHPDNARTCCPQHPIRLEASSFRPSRSQKRALQEFKSKVRRPETGLTKAARIKGKHSVLWDLQREVDSCLASSSSTPHFANKADLHAQRANATQAWRRTRRTDPSVSLDTSNPLLRPLHLMPVSAVSRLKVTLRRATSTTEKYELFRRYQASVHKESEAKISKRTGWERFLCQAPFDDELLDGEVDIKSEEKIGFGLYHMEYTLDDKLICVGVLDILPLCVSSVYLFYEPDRADLQLGKVSALFEIDLVLKLQRKKHMEKLVWYYMGFYIHDCEKMLYKATFKPSQLLDVFSNTWVPMDDVVSTALANGARYGFADAAMCVQDEALRLRGLKNGNTSVSSFKAKSSERAEKKQFSRGDDSDDEDSSEDEDEPAVSFPHSPPPGFLDPIALEAHMLGLTLVLDSQAQSRGIMPFMMSQAAKRAGVVASLREVVATLRDTTGFVFVV